LDNNVIINEIKVFTLCW